MAYLSRCSPIDLSLDRAHNLAIRRDLEPIDELHAHITGGASNKTT